MAAGESPAAEMSQECIADHRWLYCSCCRDFSPIFRPPFVTASKKHFDAEVAAAFLRFSRMPGGGFSAGTGGGETFDGEYQRKEMTTRSYWNIKTSSGLKVEMLVG